MHETRNGVGFDRATQKEGRVDNRDGREIGRLLRDFVAGELSRRDFLSRLGALGGVAALGSQLAVPAATSAAPRAQSGSNRIRKLQLLTEPQASVPEEFEGIQLAAQQLKQIGLDIDVQAMPCEQ